MKIGLVIVILGAFCVAGSQVPDDRSAVAYRGFTLAAGRCPPLDIRCVSKGPKPWSDNDLATVKAAIDEIGGIPDGATVLSRVQARGMVQIKRLGAARRGGERLEAASAALVRSPASAAIEVYDRFFAVAGARDESGKGAGYSYTAQLLLHEFMHVIDDWSPQTEFQKLAGFVNAGSSVRFAVHTAEEVMALTEWEKQLPVLERANDFVGQHRLNRRLALGLRPVRIPTLSSIRGPAEAFADIGSHLILDPRARTYLPSDLVAFFDAQVFGHGVTRAK